MLKPALDEAKSREFELSNKKCFYSSHFDFLRATFGIRPRMLTGFMGTTGCLAGDSELIVNRNGNSRRYNIKKLCRNFGNYPGDNKKTFKDIKSNRIRSYLPDENRIGLRDFIEVVYSGVKDLYLLKLKDGKEIKATLCHKFQTKRGMIPLKELTPADSIMVDNNVTPKKSGKRPRKSHDCNVVVGEFHKYARSFVESRSGRKITRIEKHRAIHEASLNGMYLAEFQKATKFKNDLIYVNPKIYDIHHVDGDHYNNDILNLQKLTKSDHRKIHAAPKHFSQGIIEWSKIDLIEYHGKEECFDVYEVKGTNNFAANGIIVSNSGKSTLLKSVVAEAAEFAPVLIWLSEETIQEYQSGILRYARLAELDVEKIKKNLFYVEEKNLENFYTKTQDVFFELFKDMIVESGAKVVFIDNLSTSEFYSDEIGPSGQSRSAVFLSKVTKQLDVAIVFVIHTSKNITDNHHTLITKENCRGLQKIVILSEYFYILQVFTADNQTFVILKIDKHRHHNINKKFYLLAFDNDCYRFDKAIEFEVLNKIFMGRNQLGRKKK